VSPYLVGRSHSGYGLAILFSEQDRQTILTIYVVLAKFDSILLVVSVLLFLTGMLFLLNKFILKEKAEETEL